MNKSDRGLAFGLTVLMVSAIVMAFAPLALAAPTATDFGVADNSGYQGTHVLVPVNVTNAQDGPITAIIFNVLYNNSVINVTDIQKGTLTSDWDSPSYNNFSWGTRVSIVYDAVDEHAIQNGSTGSVVVLNFSVIGEPGETSRMNFTDIQLAEGPPDYQIGTASAKNGTFSVLILGLIEGQITNCTGTGIAGATVNLTTLSLSVVKTTTTNETGYYNFTNVEVGNYYVNASNLTFWENSTAVAVESVDTETVNMNLWKKGDFNDNGDSADAGDLTMVKDASVEKITPDWKYDLNTNGLFADAGDLTSMKDASVEKIVLY